LLKQVLLAVDAAGTPEAAPDLGDRVWARLAPQRWWWMRMPRWVLAGALATSLIAAFVAGRASRPNVSPPPAASAQVRERILLVALDRHLERSQIVLVELANAPRGELDITLQKESAEDLLESNRLYRQAAHAAGESGLATVLDDLERFLLEIAHSPSRLDEGRMEEIRARMEAQGILFQVRALGTQVRERGTAPRL
jgi:hypothetical protein